MFVFVVQLNVLRHLTLLKLQFIKWYAVWSVYISSLHLNCSFTAVKDKIWLQNTWLRSDDMEMKWAQKDELHVRILRDRMTNYFRFWNSPRIFTIKFMIKAFRIHSCMTHTTYILMLNEISYERTGCIGAPTFLRWFPPHQYIASLRHYVKYLMTISKIATWNDVQISYIIHLFCL